MRYNEVAKEELHYERRINNPHRRLGTAPLQLPKKHSPTIINTMRLKGTLEQYLIDLNRDTQETYGLLIRQYAEIEGVT